MFIYHISICTLYLTGMVNVVNGGSLESYSSIHLSRIAILSSGNFVFSTFFDLDIIQRKRSILARVGRSGNSSTEIKQTALDLRISLCGTE